MATIEKRTSDDGEISYRVKIRLRGFPPQSATFKRLTDAKKWEKTTETAIIEGRYFKTSEAKKHTLAELVDRYIKTVIPTKSKNSKHKHNQTAQLEWWKSHLGHYVLADTTPALIAEHRDKLANEEVAKGKKRSAATVNRYLAALSHAFTVAVKEWGWVEDNPLRKVSKPKEPRGRIRFLSEEERPRLLEACRESQEPCLYLIVVLALSTGARKAELLNLHWQDVDFNRAIIVLHETKNGERRLLPLAGHALQLMKEHSKIKRLNCDLVFPDATGKKPMTIRNAWDTALKKAEINNYRFHDNRHSAASYLVMGGCSLAEVAEVLGHKTLSMIKRYAHLSEAHTAGVVARMNERIFG